MTFLAVVLWTLFELYNGAFLMAWGESQAVYITSVPWEKPGATNPYVRVMTPDVDDALNPTDRSRLICIRSEHTASGELYVTSDRFPPVSIPHSTLLATRCATVETYPWPQERPGRIFVGEGTYWGQNGQTERPVEGWIRNVTVRKVA